MPAGPPAIRSLIEVLAFVFFIFRIGWSWIVIYKMSMTGKALRWAGRVSVVTLALVSLVRVGLRLPTAPAGARAFMARPEVGAALDALFFAATAGLFAAGIAAVVYAIRAQSHAIRTQAPSRRLRATGLRIWRPSDQEE